MGRRPRTLADLQRAPDAGGRDAQVRADDADGVEERQRAPEQLPPDQLPLQVQRVRTFDTPEFAGMRFLEVETRSALNRVQGMPFDWSVNPYRGCSHACAYCFARPTHTYLNLSPLGDFERTVVVKNNVAEVLDRELARPSWSGAHVALGTNTDPYQRAEGRYCLMPGIIAALTRWRTPFSVLTKGTLIRRDTEALVEAHERVGATAALSIGTLDEGLAREIEPGTPSPRARLDAVARLNDAGIPTGVMLAPIIPVLGDDRDELATLVDEAAEAGATHITPVVLHLRAGVREVFWPWLEAQHPELVDRYRGLYARGSEADRSYREDLLRFVGARRRAALARHGPAEAGRWRGQEVGGSSRVEPSGAARVEPGGAARVERSPSPSQLSLLD